MRNRETHIYNGNPIDAADEWMHSLLAEVASSADEANQESNAEPLPRLERPEVKREGDNESLVIIDGEEADLAQSVNDLMAQFDDLSSPETSSADENDSDLENDLQADQAANVAAPVVHNLSRSDLENPWRPSFMSFHETNVELITGNLKYRFVLKCVYLMLSRK